MNRSKRISSVVLAGILAASLSVTAFADDTAANAETPSLVATNEADEDVRLLKDVFQKAVYALSEDGVMKGALSFHNETEGVMYTVSDDKIVTEPFTVEYTDDGIVFHFGGVDNVTPTICDGNGITFDFGDAGVVTYEVNLKDDTTPEDFEESMELTMGLANVVFSHGVFSLTNENGEIDFYLVLDDAETGRMLNADGIGGVPFSMEQYAMDGYIMFHMGGIDDETKVEVDVANRQIILAGKTYTYDFLEDEDPDTFEVEAPADAAILEEDEGYVPESLYGVDGQDTGAVAFAVTGDEVKSASTSSNFTLYLKFNSATPFSVKAHVKLTSGIEKLYTIEGSGKNAESWFPMQDMLDALHITVDEIDRIDLDGDTNFKGASFTNTYASGKDENPATGVGLAVVPMLASCAAMMLSKKRK